MLRQILKTFEENNNEFRRALLMGYRSGNNVNEILTNNDQQIIIAVNGAIKYCLPINIHIKCLIKPIENS